MSKTIISETPIIITMTALPDDRRGEKVKMFNSFQITVKRNGTDLEDLRSKIERSIKYIAREHNAIFDATH